MLSHQPVEHITSMMKRFFDTKIRTILLQTKFFSIKIHFFIKNNQIVYINSQTLTANTHFTKSNFITTFALCIPKKRRKN